MTDSLDQPSSAPQRYLPWLLFLFVGSGCAALIYEIVWLQLLQLVIGVSPVSLGVLLGTFMGGMCLGSLLLPRFIPRRHHPLRVYAFLELGIAAFGLLDPVRHAVRRPGVHGVGRIELEPVPALPRRQPVPAAADAAHGGDAAGDVAVGGDDAEGRVVARLLLRREHLRRGAGQSARRLLSTARVRRHDRDPGRARAQRDRRARWIGHRARHTGESTGG